MGELTLTKEPGKKPTSESRMWVYASGERGVKPVRYFEYQPDRSGKHPAVLLKKTIESYM